jgi:hypothetical protein
MMQETCGPYGGADTSSDPIPCHIRTWLTCTTTMLGGENRNQIEELGEPVLHFAYHPILNPH